MMEALQLVECPRDAMQGWKHFIPTDKKIEYINSLLQVGFHTIDFGSFVSPKAIPQMADTREVLSGLQLPGNGTQLLAIVANERGAEEAAGYEEIQYLGFPFSIAPTFQQRNTNSSQEESLRRVDAIQELCVQKNKQLVIYLSMAFGNPYGDTYTAEVLLQWAALMVEREIRVVSLADTVGLATADDISFALNTLMPQYTDTLWGVHLHSTPRNWKEKLDAAIDSGCLRFDGALKGIGGCPMAGDDLVGNMDSELVIDHLKKKGMLNGLNEAALQKSLELAARIFV